MISMRVVGACVLGAAVSLVLGCEGGGGLQRGFTECSGSTCQPGQYCADALYCENGCLSDVNCAEGQTCVDVGSGFRGEGLCVNTSMPMVSDGGPPVVEPNAQCVRVCDALLACSPSGSRAECLANCPTLPPACVSCLDASGSDCDLAQTCAPHC